MSRKPGPLDAISVLKPCPADWQAMAGDRRRRFCQECNKHVYNLSAMSRDEAEALVARFEGRLCARFERADDGVILTDDLRAAPHLISRRVSPVGAALVTAIIGLSGNAMTTTANPSTPAVHAQSGKGDRAPQPQSATASLDAAAQDSATGVREFVTVGVVAFQPQPLRALHQKSELIVVGRVGRSAAVKSAERNDMMKTTLEVTSVVKGEGKPSKVTVYNWGWGEDKQFPGGLKTGDAALFFLKRRETGDGFEVTDYSYGVKKLAPADLSVYLERLNELNAMARAYKPDTAAIVEWLVRCAEQRATHWEGAFELARSVEPDEDEPSDAEESDEAEAPDDGMPTVSAVATVKPAEQIGAPSATDSTCSKTADESRFAAMLSDEQKGRLRAALFSLDALTEQDMELVALVQHWKDERLVPFLLDQLRRLEANPPRLAERITEALAEATHDGDLELLAEAYRNDASYEDLEAEEEKADADAADDESAEAGEEAGDESSDEAG
ncbi:MAG TPA: hypothetical protein VJZ91_08135, partial [Blastocatellia bacterium]|nr:hypothetical protein [Blastocatellia bacterium]